VNWAGEEISYEDEVGERVFVMRNNEEYGRRGEAGIW
jgi:hypothetical protein